MRMKMTLCSIAVLLSCVVSAYSASAPGDADPFCATSFPGGPPVPSFPSNVRVLLDSYNYINLLPPHDQTVWQMVDNDLNNEAGRGTSWTQNTNIPCRQRVTACGFAVGPQNNWLITQYITRPDPDLTQVSVLVEFELIGCSDRSCEKTFVLNKYETPMLTPTEAGDTSRYSFVSRVATSDDTGLTIQNRTTELDFSTNSTGFYLAIVDESTCISISRVVIFYNVCPEGVEDLVIRPETLAPRIERLSSPFAVSAQCVDGASPENGQSARLLCNQGGVWTRVLGSGCRCDPGRELSEDGRSCIASTATENTTFSPPTSPPSPVPDGGSGSGSGSGAGLEIEFEQIRYEVAEDIGLDNLALRVCVRIRSLRSPQTVTVSAISGNATNGVDFSFRREELQLIPGNFLRCVAVVIYEDQLFEDDENFFLVIEETGDIAEIIILDGDTTSFNFTGNTPTVRGDTVLFRLSFGPGVERALCAVLYRSDVLAETDCSDGFAFFSDIRRRFVELTPRITLFGRDGGAPVVITDTTRNFRLTAGVRRRCSVHLINNGITMTHSGDTGAVTTVEWGVAAPVGVAPSDITFTCSLDGGRQFPCNSPFMLEMSARSLFVRPPRRAQGCIRGIPRTFNIF